MPSKAESLFTKIDELLSHAQHWEAGRVYQRSSEKWDRYLLHPVWGYVFFFFILFLLFQAVFYLADYPNQWIEAGFISAANWIESSLPAGPLNNLMVNGILPGLSGVLMFLPQIGILFFFLIVLEDSGYMVRATLLM
ncbi:MAG: hypothetical protein LPK45_03440, partial [Bacteroidota bacterium]|nr:hypothetical protein [Bacteroidota bacterium]MDX5430101.1 hypothetical protein [Bacteroidota bacterium]MDX5468865.1 hypothetical protein [Bacteroidota bacterium]